MLETLIQKALMRAARLTATGQFKLADDVYVEVEAMVASLRSENTAKAISGMTSQVTA